MRITAEGIAVVEGDTHLSKWIEEQKTLEVAAGFCRLFSRYIPEGGVVYDIGACLGDHTATYSKMVGDNGFVYAFEPNKPALACLSHNMRLYPNVAVLPFALGENQSTGKFRPSLTQHENLGASQLVEGNEIEVRSLDSLSLAPSNFIKIDAEGWEPRVIKGGIKTIAKSMPVILVEVNRPILKVFGFTDRDIFGPLSSLGYRFEPCEPHLSIQDDQTDVLCLPN